MHGTLELFNAAKRSASIAPDFGSKDGVVYGALHGSGLLTSAHHYEVSFDIERAKDKHLYVRNPSRCHG